MNTQEFLKLAEHVIVDNHKTKVSFPSEELPYFTVETSCDIVANCEIQNLRNAKSVHVLLGYTTFIDEDVNGRTSIKVPDIPVHVIGWHSFQIRVYPSDKSKPSSFTWKSDEVYIVTPVDKSMLSFVVEGYIGGGHFWIYSNRSKTIRKLIMRQLTLDEFDDELSGRSKMIDHLKSFNNTYPPIKRSDLLMPVIRKLSKYPLFDKNLIHIIKDYFDYDKVVEVLIDSMKSQHLIDDR